MGCRFENIQKALRLITSKVLKEVRVSVIFETEAILPPDAPPAWNLPYFNLVVCGQTSLSPLSLLKVLKEIEKELGRNHKAERWAPRIIDLDILAWGEEVINESGLVIPHSELLNRPFLLTLIASLRSDWRYPVPNSSLSCLTVSEILHCHIKNDTRVKNCFVSKPLMVGVVNVTPDSFSDGGKYYSTDQAVKRVHELIAQGASVIDLGAQSTRPGAVCVSVKEEWSRLEPVLNQIKEDFQRAAVRPLFSLDSFYPEIIEKAVNDYLIDWINDVSGGEGQNFFKIVAERNCKVILHHSLGIPPTSKRVLPFNREPILCILNWLEEKIKILNKFGISKDRIILDPGIGFGKTDLQSLSLLRTLDLLKKTGYEILMGHSRKSFLNIIANKQDRDLETLGISHYLYMKKIDYIRVHDVEAHQRSLTAFALVEDI